MMREPKNVRHLVTQEEVIARKVYRQTIPYHEILVTDGLGADDRPFTVPTSMPMRIPDVSDIDWTDPRTYKNVRLPNYNVKGGKYVMHVGDGYNGMTRTKDDRELLIHELAHVWQGEHYSSWSWKYVLDSAVDQVFSSDAYDYDKSHLGAWDDYGPEQQAQIIEDWFADGMKGFDPVRRTGDKRFYYIWRYIWRQRVDYDWTEDVLTPLDAGTLHAKIAYPPTPAAALLAILEAPVRADDHRAIAARTRQLEEFCNKRGPESAHELLMRLEGRHPSDKLAQAFHHRLATATRLRLMHILRITASSFWKRQQTRQQTR